MRKGFKVVATMGIAAALLLTGCGQSAPATEATPDQSTTETQAAETTKADVSGEKTVLRVAWWGNTERDKLYYAINDMFMAEHPNVQIETESPGWNDYWVAQSTAYASGSAADVVQFQSNQIGEYCSKNVLAPIDEYVSNGTIDLTNWNQGFVDTGKYKDNLYMVTLGITAQNMYINETYLEELGMELWPEDEDITWSEFADYLGKVQEKLPDDTYACLDIYNNNDLVWVWIRENSEDGNEWVNENGEFAPSEETMKSWYEYSDNMRTDGVTANIEWTQEWVSKAWEEGPLVNRKVLFYFANANQIKTYQKSMQDTLAIRKVPVGDNGKHGDLLITSAFGISETSTQKDLAAEYINFFVNNEEAQTKFNMELGVPGSLNIQDMLSANGADPSDVKATEYLNMVSKDAPAFKPKEPGVWAIQDEISSTAENVAIGALTPDDAAKHIADVANEIIAENAE
ncbi:MAG: extracellular solute-binding protein [Lachnospiraceae bacterium]|nr:extracellular solute-binding protein [Lachnospiraceae bacterium]